MKKVLTMVSIIVALLSIQLYVNADMGIPAIKPYEAVVTNVDGAECYIGYGSDARREILPYGTKIIVEYEIRNEDGFGASIRTEDNYINGTIDISDIKPVNDIYVSNDLNKDEPNNFVVLAKYGVEIYNGPADAYSKTGVVIPVGTEIVGYSENGAFDSPWYYVTYNGQSGWICELDAVLAKRVEEDTVFLTISETELMEYGVIGDEIPKELAKVPANTFFDNVYVTDPWSQSYLVIYDGMLGEIYNRAFAWDHEPMSGKITGNPVKMYKECDESSEVLIEEIPVGTIITFELENEYSGMVYAKYNGQTGWINLDYDERLENADKSAELPEVVRVNFDNDKILSMIKGTGNSNEVINEDSIIGNTLENKTDSNGNENDSNVNTTISLTGVQFVGLIIAIAIVVCLTCVVTIVLVNKKSKMKKDADNKVEKNDDKVTENQEIEK